jgi:hypothetical protein
MLWFPTALAFFINFDAFVNEKLIGDLYVDALRFRHSISFDASLQLRLRLIKLQSTFLKILVVDSVSLEKGNTELKTLESRSASLLSISM